MKRCAPEVVPSVGIGAVLHEGDQRRANMDGVNGSDGVEIADEVAGASPPHGRGPFERHEVGPHRMTGGARACALAQRPADLIRPRRP